MSYSGRYSSKKNKKNGNHHGGKGNTVWIVLGVILGVVLVVGIAVVIYVNSMLGLVRRPTEESKDPDPSLIAELIGNTEVETESTTAPETTEETVPDYSKTGKIINIMVVGQASRSGESSKLSDTMLLLTINRETNTMTMTSFLRDMYIKLPDMWGHKCGKNRINTAYALGTAWKGELGGMQMLDKLILEQFGTTVDYNVEVDFLGFITIINTIGGITMELNEEEVSYMQAASLHTDDFVVGQNNLCGECALAFARMRHATPADSDMNRTGRQRRVIDAVLSKCRSMDIGQLHNLMTQLLPLVLTDMPNDVILTYAAELLPSIGTMKLESMQIPAEGTYHGEVIEIYNVSSGVLIPDVKANRELLMAVAEADAEENP